MPQGTIKKLFTKRGYGFVKGAQSFYWFFHQSALDGTTIDSLRVGQAVEYDEGCGPTGPRADNVKPVDGRGPFPPK